MEISEKYSVETLDSRNVVIYEKTTVKDEDSKNFGEPVKKIIGYYSNFQQAYKAICDKEIRGTGLKDIKTVLDKIDELFDYIDLMVE